ncbi:MAG: hypothetical protein N2379_09830, partial [Verrucomicrobiae bacterium]|nr:hypothetical protein [Verrucomicrobiae bacterium]
ESTRSPVNCQPRDHFAVWHPNGLGRLQRHHEAQQNGSFTAQLARDKCYTLVRVPQTTAYNLFR